MDLDDLIRLSLRELAIHFIAESSGATGMDSQGWYSLISAFSMRVSTEDRRDVAENVQLLRTAYETLLAAAVADGGLEEREATLRRVHLLVLLSTYATSAEVADEQVAAARKIALDRVPIPIDLAEMKAQGWHTLPIGEIRELRFAKNLFADLRAVTHLAPGSADAAAVGAWLDLWPDLP
jgi:hypothetical protein